MRFLISAIMLTLLIPSVYAQKAPSKTVFYGSIICPAQAVKDCNKTIGIDEPERKVYPKYDSGVVTIKRYVEKRKQEDNNKKQNNIDCQDRNISLTTIKVFTDNIQVISDGNENSPSIIEIEGYIPENERNPLESASSYKSAILPEQPNITNEDKKHIKINMVSLGSGSKKKTVNFVTIQGRKIFDSYTEELISKNPSYRTEWLAVNYYELKDCAVIYNK